MTILAILEIDSCQPANETDWQSGGRNQRCEPPVVLECGSLVPHCNFSPLQDLSLPGPPLCKVGYRTGQRGPVSLVSPTKRPACVAWPPHRLFCVLLPPNEMYLLLSLDITGGAGRRVKLHCNFSPADACVLMLRNHLKRITGTSSHAANAISAPYYQVLWINGSTI